MKTNSYNGLLYNDGNFSHVTDMLAIEESLSIAINEEPFTVTMRTPGHELELVQGLLFTEGVYRQRLNTDQLQINSNGLKGFITSLNLVLPQENLLKDFASSRNIISASSCGLCGRTSFEETLSTNTINDDVKIDPRILEYMFAKMSEAQLDFRSSGGTHAAAAFSIDGEMIAIFEDIGRHNAVDKVIGSLVLQQTLPKAKCITVSGRVSYEIVNKVQAAGIPVLAAVSAPSSMAVENAVAAGMTLIAFCRSKKLTVYAHPERILQTEFVLNNK